MAMAISTRPSSRPTTTTTTCRDPARRPGWQRLTQEHGAELCRRSRRGHRLAARPDPGGHPADQHQQSALLDNLGNALVKASDEVKAHCPTTVSFAPTARLDAMKQRVQALADAVNIVSPPLDKFYASLSDEQKARFNDIAAAGAAARRNAPKRQPGVAESAGAVQCQCHGVADRSDRSRGAPRRRAAGKTRCACSPRRRRPRTTSRRRARPNCRRRRRSRLAAIGKRLDAMLHGIQYGAAGACRLLRLAQRRTEGPFRRHGPAVVRGKLRIAFPDCASSRIQRVASGSLAQRHS